MADKSDTIKRNLIIALEKTLGVVSDACKKVKISRQTFYEWYKTDEQFKSDVDELNDMALDFAESQLFKNIKRGSDAATIFYLKTKGKKRGYVEKTETESKNFNYNSEPLTKEKIKEIKQTLENDY